MTVFSSQGVFHRFVVASYRNVCTYSQTQVPLVGWSRRQRRQWLQQPFLPSWSRTQWRHLITSVSCCWCCKLECDESCFCSDAAGVTPADRPARTCWSLALLRQARQCRPTCCIAGTLANCDAAASLQRCKPICGRVPIFLQHLSRYFSRSFYTKIALSIGQKFELNIMNFMKSANFKTGNSITSDVAEMFRLSFSEKIK